jgi:hypothetical protein
MTNEDTSSRQPYLMSPSTELSKAAQIRRLALDPPAVSPGAAFEPLGNGACRIITPSAPWHQAVGFPLGEGESARGVLALVVCRRGRRERSCPGWINARRARSNGQGW